MMDDTDSTEFNALRRKLLKHIAVAGLQELLTERQRQIYIMYHYQNMTIPAIAKTLGVQKSTISRTLKRAENNLSVIAKILSKT